MNECKSCNYGKGCGFTQDQGYHCTIHGFRTTPCYMEHVKCKYCDIEMTIKGCGIVCPCCNYWQPIEDQFQQIRICKHIEIKKK